MIDSIRKKARKFLPAGVLKAYDTRNSLRPISERNCNVCNFTGQFTHYGRPPRLDAMCPSCRCLERHRLLIWALESDGVEDFDERAEHGILHFAPEKELETYFRARYEGYSTADLFAPADNKVDIERMSFSDQSFGIVIANHVLEHVDDLAASLEVYRVLKPGGIFIAMVPIVEAWKHTYENPDFRSPEDRLLYFGQEDHVRFYGSDFPSRVERGGLLLEQAIQGTTAALAKHSFLRGEKVFVFRKKNPG